MRNTILLLFSVMAVLAVPSIAWAQTAPSLTGEVFTEGATPPTIEKVRCDPDGTSTWTYTFSDGVAVGPFPGEVSETALVELDPLTEVSPENPFGFAAGTVVTVNATFQVEGPLGTVNGIKLLQTVVPENLGTCTDAPFLTPVPGTELCTAATYVQATADVDYFAEIDPIEGETVIDEGDSALAMTGLTCNGAPQNGTLDETFVSSTVPTPGHASGGGIIESVTPEQGISFGFSAKSDLNGVSGRCSVIRHRTLDDSTRSKVTCLDVTSYTQILNHVTITGSAEVDGAETTYTIDVTDGGPDGEDTFVIETTSGFVAGGVVTRGNVRVG
jgi:hypothetical protein